MLRIGNVPDDLALSGPARPMAVQRAHPQEPAGPDTSASFNPDQTVRVTGLAASIESFFAFYKATATIAMRACELCQNEILVDGIRAGMLAIAERVPRAPAEQQREAISLVRNGCAEFREGVFIFSSALSRGVDLSTGEQKTLAAALRQGGARASEKIESLLSSIPIADGGKLALSATGRNIAEQSGSIGAAMLEELESAKRGAAQLIYGRLAKCVAEVTGESVKTPSDCLGAFQKLSAALDRLPAASDGTSREAALRYFLARGCAETQGFIRMQMSYSGSDFSRSSPEGFANHSMRLLGLLAAVTGDVGPFDAMIRARKEPDRPASGDPILSEMHRAKAMIADSFKARALEAAAEYGAITSHVSWQPALGPSVYAGRERTLDALCGELTVELMKGEYGDRLDQRVDALSAFGPDGAEKLLALLNSGHATVNQEERLYCGIRRALGTKS